MNCKDTIKVILAGGAVVIGVLLVQHLCKEEEAKNEHNYEMEEESLRHQHLNEILEKLQPSEVNNYRNKAA